MIAELTGPRFEQDCRLIREQWRQRILAAAWRFEDIASVDLASAQIARLAGNAEFVLGAIVVSKTAGS